MCCYQKNFSADFNIWSNSDSLLINHRSPLAILKKCVAHQKVSLIADNRGSVTSEVVFLILHPKDTAVVSIASYVRLKFLVQIDSYELKIFLKIRNEQRSSFPPIIHV